MTAIRRQHLSGHLHRLGARAVDELLAELGVAHDIEADMLLRLECYGRLSPAVVRALGGANLPGRDFLAIDGEAA